MASVAPAGNEKTGASTSIDKERLKFSQKVLFYVGIGQFTTGCLAFIFSAVLLGLSFGKTKYAEEGAPTFTTYRLIFNVGEGVWCGIWIVIAGGLSVLTGKQWPTARFINGVMGMNIVAIIFSMIMILLALISARINYRFQTLVGLEVVVALLGLFALILSITSAIYCWIAATSAAIPDCCAGFFFRQEVATNQVTAEAGSASQKHQPKPVPVKPRTIQSRKPKSSEKSKPQRDSKVQRESIVMRPPSLVIQRPEPPELAKKQIQPTVVVEPVRPSIPDAIQPETETSHPPTADQKISMVEPGKSPSPDPPTNTVEPTQQSSPEEQMAVTETSQPETLPSRSRESTKFRPTSSEPVESTPSDVEPVDPTPAEPSASKDHQTTGAETVEQKPEVEESSDDPLKPVNDSEKPTRETSTKAQGGEEEAKSGSPVGAN